MSVILSILSVILMIVLGIVSWIFPIVVLFGIYTAIKAYFELMIDKADEDNWWAWTSCSLIIGSLLGIPSGYAIFYSDFISFPVYLIVIVIITAVIALLFLYFSFNIVWFRYKPFRIISTILIMPLTIPSWIAYAELDGDLVNTKSSTTSYSSSNYSSHSYNSNYDIPDVSGYRKTAAWDGSSGEGGWIYETPDGRFVNKRGEEVNPVFFE